MTNTNSTAHIIPATELERELLTDIVKRECRNYGGNIEWTITTDAVMTDGFIDGAAIHGVDEPFDLVKFFERPQIAVRYFVERETNGGFRVWWESDDSSNYFPYGPVFG